MAAPADAAQPIRWKDDDYMVLTFAVPTSLAARLQKQAEAEGHDPFDVARDAIALHLDAAEAERGAWLAPAAIAAVPS